MTGCFRTSCCPEEPRGLGRARPRRPLHPIPRLSAPGSRNRRCALGKVHHRDHLPAGKLLRDVMGGYLCAAPSDPDLWTEVDRELYGGSSSLGERPGLDHPTNPGFYSLKVFPGDLWHPASRFEGFLIPNATSLFKGFLPSIGSSKERDEI